MPLLHRIKAAMGKKAMSNLRYERFLPKVLAGHGSLCEVGQMAMELKMKKVLVVTDVNIVNLGIVDRCVELLKEVGIEAVVYSGVLPDPAIEQVLEGAKMYKQHGCNGLIAIGGGSSIDCAKTISAYVVDPRPIEEFAGIMKLKVRGASLIAIPTTAGTGSEATYSAVITCQDKKLLISDFKLLAKGAILDPDLLIDLPPAMIAATGMDALTHAIEAFLSPWGNDYSEEKSILAAKAIFKNLVPVYRNGRDLSVARHELLTASFNAGIAVSCCGIGYVHAIAHAFGGRYHTPHGVANAMILPEVLRFYGAAAHKKLAILARETGFGSADEGDGVLAKRIIARIDEMRNEMAMDSTVKGLLMKDCEQVAALALQESHGEQHSMLWNFKEFMKDTGYPTIKYMSLQDCTGIIRKFVPKKGDTVFARL